MLPALFPLEDSSYCQYLAVIVVGYGDSGALVGGVYDLAVADINSHMAGVTDQIARLRIFHAVHCIALRTV